MVTFKNILAGIVKPQDINDVMAGAKLSFFEDQTNNPVQMFADAEYAVPFSNPVVADSNGEFPRIFVRPGLKLRAELRDWKDNYLAIATRDDNFGVGS